MKLEKIIAFHQKKLQYHTDEWNVFLNLPDWAKTGEYKALYYKQIVKHNEGIDFHTQAIQALEECL